MNVLEWTAAALGLVNIALVVRRSVWNYPFGLAMVTLYFFVFTEAKLYSDALLQIFFFAIQLYGWRNWSRAGAGGAVPVRWMGARDRVLWLAGTATASLGWGLLMARLTDAVAPMTDAAIAGMSVAAQLLLSFRRVENWLFWIAVDLVAIGLFSSRGLHATAALYAVFLVMATAGLVGWTKAARQA
jgi:nicotinamide mononucleotide transporter